MTTRPPGIYTLRFCTVNAPLSNVALLEFAAGRGLPSGSASPVETLVVVVRSPAGVKTRYTGGAVVTDAPGLYHALVEMREEGEWQWEGQGWEGGQLVSDTGVIPWLIGQAIEL